MQARALGALVYCLGRFYGKEGWGFSKYCIPAPVAEEFRICTVTFGALRGES